MAILVGIFWPLYRDARCRDISIRVKVLDQRTVGWSLDQQMWMKGRYVSRGSTVYFANVLNKRKTLHEICTKPQTKDHLLIQ